MNIITKLLIFLFFIYLFINKRDIKLLLLSFFSLIEFFRNLFSEKILSDSLIFFLNLTQLLIIVTVFILYLISFAKLKRK